MMACTSTYCDIWKRYEKLRRRWNVLIEQAFEDDSTVAQYAGPFKLAKLVNEIDTLLDDCSQLVNEDDRLKAQSIVISLLYSVEEALTDACLFECDQAASFEDFVSSRPCPIPMIVTS